jgi:CheY-like chemotaxis protein
VEREVIHLHITELISVERHIPETFEVLNVCRSAGPVSRIWHRANANKTTSTGALTNGAPSSCPCPTKTLFLAQVQMPVLDGLEATEQIRQWENSSGRSRIPIIGMTAHAMARDRDRCLEAGMDAYMRYAWTLKSLLRGFEV